MAATTAQSFIASLRKSKLLTPEQWDRIQHEFVPVQDVLAGRDIGKRLIERGWLTRWQAQMVLEGRGGFFLGRYRLVDRLGSGGMGSVFKAQHATLGRVVALKIMSRSLLKNEAAIARFHREIQNAAVLDHPHIVAAYDADSAQGTHFLVMEYVDGRNLAEISLKHGPLPVAFACECIRQAALGLAHAHEMGMVHRDVKPSNVLLVNRPPGEPPIVKLLDFGLARLASETVEAGDLTRSGQVLGTPDYIAPEQARNTRSADIRSDIYSLGCTLYRLLTGELPFKGDNLMEKLMARAMAEAPRVRSLRPDVPPALDAVVARMMARNPAERLQKPMEVAEALAPFAGSAAAAPLPPPNQSRSAAPPAAVEAPPHDNDLDLFLQQLSTEAVGEEAVSTDSMLRSIGDSPTVSRYPNPPTAAEIEPTGPGSTASERLRARFFRSGPESRRSLIVALASAAVLTIAAVAGWIYAHLGQSELVVHWACELREGGELEFDGRPITVPAADSDSIVIPTGSGTHKIRISRPGYKSIEESIAVERGERHEWSPEWVPTADTRRRQTLEQLSSTASTLRTAAPDAAELIRLESQLVEFRTRHHGTREVEQAGAVMSQLAWPADRLEPGSISPIALQIVTANTGVDPPRELVAVLGDARLSHPQPITRATLSPDGRTLATASEDATIRLWDPATRSLRKVLRHHSATIHGVAFSPDSHLLASAGDDGAVIFDVAGEKIAQTLQGHKKRVLGVAFSFDGETVATAGDDHLVGLWRARTGELIRMLKGHGQPVTALAFGRDEDWLASGSADGTVRLWPLAGDPGREPVVLPFGREHIQSVAIAPSGARRLAVASQSGKAWLIQPEEAQKARVPLQMGGATAVAFSRDGGLLAVGMSGFGGITVWNLETPRPASRGTYRVHSDWVNSVEFTTDNKTVISASRDGHVQLTDVSGNDMAVKEHSGHTAPATAVAFSPNGITLVSGGRDRTVREWDIARAAQRRVLDNNTPGHISRLAYSPDGALLAGSVWDGLIRVWDTELGGQRFEMRKQAGALRCLTFDPEGKLLASAVWKGDSNVKLYDMETGLLEKSLDAIDNLHAVAFAPDGKSLATAANALELWDLPRCRKRFRLGQEAKNNTFRTLAFSPEGSLLAGGQHSGIVEIWNVRSQQLVHALHAHSGLVEIVTFSPDGKLLATCGGDGTAAVFDVESGDQLKKFAIAKRGLIVMNVAFTPDSRHIATANPDGTIYLFRLRERQ